MADTKEPSTTLNKTPTTVSIILVVVFALTIGALACIARRCSPLRVLRQGTHRPANETNTTGGLGKNTVHHIPLVAYCARSSRLVDAHTLKTENKRSGHGSSDGVIQFPGEVLVRPSKPTRSQSESRCGGDQSECPICTEDFVDGVLLRLLPCEHMFHPTCIDPWLSWRARTCPIW